MSVNKFNYNTPRDDVATREVLARRLERSQQELSKTMEELVRAKEEGLVICRDLARTKEKNERLKQREEVLVKNNALLIELAKGYADHEKDLIRNLHQMSKVYLELSEAREKLKQTREH